MVKGSGRRRRRASDWHGPASGSRPTTNLRGCAGEFSFSVRGMGIWARQRARLGERERRILRLRFGLDQGEPRTLDEVGNEMNLTRERIRQIERAALAKLRSPAFEAAARDLLAS